MTVNTHRFRQISVCEPHLLGYKNYDQREKKEHYIIMSSEAQSSEHPLLFSLRIPMPSTAAAKLALQVMRVDPPLQGSTRTLEEEHHVVVIRLQSASSRALRTAVHATLEQLTLITRTLEAFS